VFANTAGLVAATDTMSIGRVNAGPRGTNYSKYYLECETLNKWHSR
jgi:hypothetical protein